MNGTANGPRRLPQLDLPSLRKREQKPAPRWQVLWNPDGAFVSAVLRPRLLLSLVVVAFFAVLPPAAYLLNAARSEGVKTLLLDEMRKNGRLAKLQGEQRANLEKVMVPVMTAALPVGAIAKRELWVLFCATVCMAFLRGTRPQLTFPVVVAVAAAGAAPLFVHDVLSAAAFSAFDLHGIDPQNPVASNPAAWLFSGKETRTPLAALLRNVDFFELWACAWIAGGLTRAAGGRTSLPTVVVFGGHLAMTLKDVASAAAVTASS